MTPQHESAKMCKPLNSSIESLAFIYAHCGSRGDGDKHIYEVAVTVIERAYDVQAQKIACPAF